MYQSTCIKIYPIGKEIFDLYSFSVDVLWSYHLQPTTAFSSGTGVFSIVQIMGRGCLDRGPCLSGKGLFSYLCLELEYNKYISVPN